MTTEEYAAFLALRENCLRDIAELRRTIERRFDAIDPGKAAPPSYTCAFGPNCSLCRENRERLTAHVAMPDRKPMKPAARVSPSELVFPQPSEFGSFSEHFEMKPRDDEPARTEQHRFYIEDEGK